MASPDTRPLALVTGASSGIGFELAKQFADNGFDLVITAEDDELAAAEADVKARGAHVEAVQVDLTTDEGVDELWRRVTASGRPLAVVTGASSGIGFELAKQFAQNGFDLVIAAEDAQFSDPVVAFGVNGHEYFVHPYEVGARKAKQMLFTGEALSAAEAHRLGMVNEVVPRDQLEAYTLEMATKVASQPLMGLKLAKMSVNQALDNMGMWNTIQAAFGLHHLGHSHNSQRFGMMVDPEGAGRIRAGATRPAPDS